ncbi:hypothetical protein FXO38_35939 [Capsicum annuum]|nr:hypothetical protein FXO38_35939 [Capsicum annuum]
MMDDGSYSRFSWGKVDFEKLMAFIIRSMNDVKKFYRLCGQPYALQIWCYECCAKVDESLAVCVHNLIPRMVNWKVVKPKPRYEDLMDDMFSKVLVNRNIIPSPQELNHLDLPNPLMFGSTDDAVNVAQIVVVQQQSERTVPTEFEDEFDDFSTPPSADLLKNMSLDVSQSLHPPTKKQKIVKELEKVRSRVAKSKKQSDKLSKDKNLPGPSIDLLKRRVSLDKDKVVPNVELREADKLSVASKEKLSLSKSDLDEIKSYVRTYVDMKFNDLQKLMVDQYTGLLGVVKEGFASFGKVAQYPMHESEKGNPDIEEDPPQSLNAHTMDAKSYNVVEVAGKSSKLGGNEGAAEESFKVPMCKTNLKYVRKLSSKRNRQPSRVYQSPFVSEFDSGSKDKEVIHMLNINRPYAEDIFSKFSVWMIIHWVLAVIVLKERCIHAYDSIKGHRGHADEIKELAEILSTYLTISDFFKKKDRTDWSLLDAYKEKSDQHAFNVHIVNGIVQQSSGTLDCGLFVAAYAEFLSDRHQIPSSEFDPKKHRTRYASLLWDYGVNKACTGYASDNQDPPRPKCSFIQSEDSKMIDVEP